MTERPTKVLLHQTPRLWGMPSASPFCIKVEFFLRAASIPYEIVTWNPMQAPRGKMPFVSLGGERIPDSQLIIQKLCEVYRLDFERHLSKDQLHLTHTLRRMLEDATYFIFLWSRWCNHDNWPRVKADYFAFMPPIVRHVIPEILRRAALRTAKGQGVARYSSDELRRTASDDVNALLHFMDDDGPYFFGEKISRIDFTAFPFLLGIRKTKEPRPLELELGRRDKLERYVDFIEQRYFPELAQSK